MERILFPDAAATVIGALNAELPDFGLTGVPVRSRVPNPRPSRFVVVYRTGGPRDGIVIDQAQLTVEAWASNDADAHDLAMAARAILQGLEGRVVGGVVVGSIAEFSGPANLPDPTSDQSRFTWSTSVQIRGTAA